MVSRIRELPILEKIHAGKGIFATVRLCFGRYWVGRSFSCSLY